MSEQSRAAVARLAEELPDGRLRICILGGTSVQRKESEELAHLVAQGLSSKLKGRVFAFTEGMPGIQNAFARHCSETILHNLVLEGQACSWHGTELSAGESISERKEIFSLLGDVYIVLEGGPGVAKQARLALKRGACILPLARTGGASSGLFDFPKKALEKPSFVEETCWEALQNAEAPTATTAEAVVAICEAASELPGGFGRSLLEAESDADADEDLALSPDSSKPLLEEAGAGPASRRNAAPLDSPREDSGIRADGLSREEIGAVREILGISRPGLPSASSSGHGRSHQEAPPLGPKLSTPMPFQRRTVPRFSVEMPVPRVRSSACFRRRVVRDAWNTQEILLAWAISRHPGRRARQRHELPTPLADETEFRWYFNLLFPSLEIDLWEARDAEGLEAAEDSASRQLQLALRSADRDGDGCVTVEELHYGLLCLHGYRSLMVHAARPLASMPVTSDQRDLQALLESLNGGIPVHAAEAQQVLREARLVRGEGVPASQSCSREELLWGVGCWYANIQREDTQWREVLAAAVRRWIPSDEEHHGCVLHELARMTMDLPRTLPMPSRLGGQVARKETSASRASQACVLLLAVAIHIVYFLLLIFPSAFFLTVIFIGSEHGDDRCPFDLDALLVWFGAVGLAVLVVDCANGGSIGITVIASGLKALLLLTPFLGMFWTHALRRADADVCGPYVFWMSKWLWSALASCELYVACLLGWSFHVARIHELALRRKADADMDAQLNPPSPEHFLADINSADALASIAFRIVSEEKRC
ncbi:unnamed protein product [Symbiodinium sp. CCMP2456]|nr:unnamed protein product [Symbiodinium sp. CCMP2456]